MAHKFAELAFTPSVRALQIQNGSRENYAAMDEGMDYNHLLTERETSFIKARDSFYLASVGESGWPYIQHRGGPIGFIKILDQKRIGFADYSGNRQYVSTGNVLKNDRVALFFMDYPNRRRLKMLGRIELTDGSEVEDEDYLATVERSFIIQVEAFDWNCPQHITPRFSEPEIHDILMPSLPQSTNDSVRPSTSTSPNADALETELKEIGEGPLKLVVTGVRQLTSQIRGYELRSSNFEELPEVSAGSNLRIPVRLSNGQLIEREYSIASDTSQRSVYEIAVLKEVAGRGGSRAVHETFTLGSRLNTDLPTNQFPLHKYTTDTQRSTVLIAGGIGITPIRSMAHELAARRETFALHYAGQSRAALAYLNELEHLFSEQLYVYPGDIKRMDIDAILASVPTHVYVCGPERLIEAVIKSAGFLNLPAEAVRFERFE